MQKIILASTSKVHGQTYLSYLMDTLKVHFKGIDEILFIPYARPGGINYEEYTAVVKTAFHEIGKKIKGIHEFDDPKKALKKAQAFFTGGGNTFVLLNTLCNYDLLDILAAEVRNGKPYLGTSAGSNIAGQNIKNTNDMPIVYPPSYRAMGLIPFNINPHFLDPILNSTHMGETRETRINEYLVFNSIPVIGLREGSWIEVAGSEIYLKGPHTARWFQQGKEAEEILPGKIS